MEHEEWEALERFRAELWERHEEWYAAFRSAERDFGIRHDQLLAWHRKLIAEFERIRDEHGRRFNKIDVAMEHDLRMNRESLLEIRLVREEGEDIRHGVQSIVEGLLRLLDEFRKGDGPSPAGA